MSSFFCCCELRCTLLTLCHLQLTYTVYAAFNLLLVSWGFGNSHITKQDPQFISNAAKVRYHLICAQHTILSPWKFRSLETGTSSSKRRRELVADNFFSTSWSPFRSMQLRWSYSRSPLAFSTFALSYQGGIK